MMKYNQKGFTLIEIVLIIVVLGVISTIAFKSMVPTLERSRESATLQEMEVLTEAISGDKNRVKDGMRTDFSYVGDVGSLPPNLDALYSNPGGYSTWDGPYIQEGYDKDGWGDSYTYTGGVVISSSGGGSTITKQFAQTSADLTSNTVTGNIYDGLGAVPGNNASNVAITIFYPDGSGGSTSSSVNPNTSGCFSFSNSIPIGNYLLRAIYNIENETTETYISVIPANESYCELRFDGSYWYSVNIIASLGNGLVGHWKLDETSGIIASDVSGNGNHGTLYNMDPASDWVTGTINGSLDFNGSNDYVQVPHSAELNGSSELTYAAWVYPHIWSGDSHRQVLAKSVHGGGSGRAQMGIFSDGGQLCGRAETSGGRMNVFAAIPTLNSWSHVALVFDSVGLKLYVNGSEGGSITFSNRTLNQTTDALNFSKRVGTAQYFFDGLIDDIRVYDRALSDSEILALFNMGS